MGGNGNASQKKGIIFSLFKMCLKNIKRLRLTKFELDKEIDYFAFFSVGCCMINATHRGAASYLSNAFVRPSYNYSRPLLEGKIVLFSTFLFVATKHLVLPAGVL